MSDNLDHTKLAIYKFVSYLIGHLKSKHPNIEQMEVFSDGPCSQFKQWYLFSNLHLLEQEYKIKLRWNFFATYHGKGVVDGIGGTIKRTVWRNVKAGKVFVATAQEYADVATLLIPNVHIKFISSDEILDDKSMQLQQYWETVLPVPSIKSVYCVKAISPNVISIADTSLEKTLKTVTIIEDEESFVEEEVREKLPDESKTG